MRSAVAGAAILSLPAIGRAQTGPIRIGYAISKTGPFTGGASVTVTPNYEMWVKEANAAGGIDVGGVKRPLEVIEYDDRSNSEECVRAVERLISQDKVDFVLPPWGTGLNLAVGPQLNIAGMPHLAVSSVTDRIPWLTKRWPNAFWFLGRSASAAEQLVATLNSLATSGRLGKTVALLGASDQFGVEMTNAARTAFKAGGFNLAMDRNYPVGNQDFAALVSEAQRANPDILAAFSYPGDTIAITEQARLLNFNPKVFYTAVGTAFPVYRDRFKENAEGVMGIGGWNADSPKLKDYLARHKAANGGREPDRWGSSVTFASLEVLGQAITRARTTDRAAVITEMEKGGFETVVGRIDFVERLRKDTWWVGQWQGGEFHGIAPAEMSGAKKLIFPKPAWRAAG